LDVDESVTLNPTALLDWFSAMIWTTAKVLAGTAVGTHAMMELAFQLTIVAVRPPIATVPGDTPKFEPVMVTSVPDGPVEGVKPAMTGAAGGRTVTEQLALYVPTVTRIGAGLLLPPFVVVTTRLPVVAPTGIESKIFEPSALV